MQNKKVGIVIPIYNVEKYLDECLRSVINQTYINLSIILVNDGSNDNSLSIARKYALQDERIIIINKKNGGLSSARNTG
ncbi:glycosyltransferase family 2 protein, partial [Campylobacter coli]|nr:glycosyltransferase family 2 protein [Campylobacter coli]